MPSAAQIKKAIQPLLQRNSDLALLNRFVIIKPVHHIQRGIFFRSGSADTFYPIWTVNVTFAPQVLGFDTIWARDVYAAPLRSGFYTYHSDVSEILCERIEQVALPLLRQVQTIDDFVAFNTSERFPGQSLDGGFDYIRVYVDIARGDFASALKFCEFVKTRGGYADFIPWAYEVFAETLYPMLMANDRVGLAQYLKDFELAEVKRRGLEKFWEPTPFPLESQSDNVRPPA
jgi:hypothetical protein